MLPIPDDIDFVLTKLFIQRNGIGQLVSYAQQGRVGKRELITEAIRRGLETLYGGVDYLPIKKEDWNTYEYKYRLQKKKKMPYIELSDEEDGQD